MADERRLAFGPVPSRRLGSSLGVNAVPLKWCTYSCVYCQLGRTTHMAANRRTFLPTSEVVTEVERGLRLAPAPPDHVTVIGEGEPTLAANIAEVREGIAGLWDGRIALLTNGSLFWKQKVREDCMGFDVVLPTVSAGSPGLFRRLHRPHPSITFERFVEGLSAFAREYDGEIWAEVMLVRGLNDSSEALEGIASLLRSLEPARVHLTAPTRPPAEPWVQCPSRDAVKAALRIIDGAEDVTGAGSEGFEVRLGDLTLDLLAIATMHPLREEQALDILTDAGMEPERARGFLLGLVAEGRLCLLEREGVAFYRGIEAHRANDATR